MLQSDAVELDGFVPAAGVTEQTAEIEIGVGVRGIDRDRLAVRLLRGARMVFFELGAAVEPVDGVFAGLILFAAEGRLGLRFRGPAVAILLKPSFLPLALIGIRSRSWWLGLGILALLSLPFLGDTLIYPKVMADSRNPDGILYSIADLPTMLIPVIAWLGRQRNPSRKRADPRVRTRAAAYDATADQ